MESTVRENGNLKLKKKFRQKHPENLRHYENTKPMNNTDREGETQVQDMGYIFSKMIEEKFPTQKKEVSIKI